MCKAYETHYTAPKNSQKNMCGCMGYKVCDLYDISGAANSMGLGNWAMMGTGSYNGGSRNSGSRCWTLPPK